MKELSYEECVQRFQSERCDNFKLSEDGKTISGLDKIKGALIIPEGVEIIDCDGQLRNDKITAIIMPDSIREMTGEVNGAYTRNLSFVRLSSNLNIPQKAFVNCELPEIIIPEGINIIPIGAFSGNSCLKEINLPSTLEFILPRAFTSCKFAEITIPEKVKVIFPTAFSNCENLKKVKISSKDTVIMEGSFEACGKYNDETEVYSFDKSANKLYEEHKIGDKTFGHGKEKYEIVDGKKILSYIPKYYCGKLKIEEGTAGFRFNAIDLFADCYGISEIYFPDSMNGISFTIGMPEYVEKIRFPQTVGKHFKIDGAERLVEFNMPTGMKILTIREGLFSKLQIPEGVEEVYLDNLKNLNNLVLPHSLKKLTLIDLPNLTDLTLPEELIILDLRELKLLNHVVIPSKVEKLLIKGLDNLEEITIPESVIDLGDPSSIFDTSFYRNEVIKSATLLCKINIRNIFKGCINLKTLTLGAGIKKFDKDFFNTLSGLETIYIPAKKMKYYSSRIPEHLHDKIVEIPVENRK